MPSMLEAVEAIQSAVDGSQIASHLTSFASQLGCEHWHMSRPSNGTTPLASKKVLGVWPQAWTEQYDHHRFFHLDEVAKACRARRQAFRWSDIPILTSGRVMAIAKADYRMHEGFCIPYFGIDGYQGAITFGGINIAQSTRAQLSLEVVAIYAFHKLNEVQAPQPQNILTARQREVMRWIAAGKTNWDTAAILHISEETVKATVKAAMERLNVHTRAQAIAEAVRRKEIQL